jgi:hypothetical protein
MLQILALNECNRDVTPTDLSSTLQHRAILVGVEPGEKFIRRLLKVVLMILAFVVSVVFGEYYRGLGWLGALIFVVGASMGALGIYLFKTLRN